MKRKSYLTNFSTDMLFIVLEQNQKELLQLQLKLLDNENILLKTRINQVKYTIAIIENTVTKRFLEENISLNKLINLLLTSNKECYGTIYKEAITQKIIESNEAVLLNLLEAAIKHLDVDQLMRIIKAKEDSIYGLMALNSYNEKCLEVDDEVYKELLLKVKQDRREC